ncbi:MAG: hypothetical protein KC561_05260 [Myxococcales bacterium]|nr:hypothetical protein [Myxococcales bacterium]
MKGNFPKHVVMLADGHGGEGLASLAEYGSLEAMSRTLIVLAETGIERLVVVTGEGAEIVEKRVRATLGATRVELIFIHNSVTESRHELGVMLGAQAVEAPYLLMRSDRLYDPAILHHALTTIGPMVGGVAYADESKSSYTPSEGALPILVGPGGSLRQIGRSVEEPNATSTGLYVMSGELEQLLRAHHERGEESSLEEAIEILSRKSCFGLRDVSGTAWLPVGSQQAWNAPVRCSEQPLRRLRNRFFT